MGALVVYESMFGDNQRVAEALAEGLVAAGIGTEAVEVGKAPATIGDGVDLLVVGAPNHGFSLPRPASREDAAKQADGPTVSGGTGVREWLAGLALPAGQRTAAFDTRMSHPKLVVKMDHASSQIEKRLTGLGGTAVTGAQHFLVADVRGPLEPGEEERARAWGGELARLVAGG